MPTLDWIGKKKMVNHHRDVSFRVLEKKYTYRDVSLGQSPLAQHDDCHSDDNEHCHSERSEESTDVSATPQHDYYLGKHNGAGYWFYYKRNEETTLDMDFVLTIQNPHTYEQFIIYADTCVLSDDYLKTHHVTFKQIPRDIQRF